MNKTNARTIARLSGGNTDSRKSAEIELFVAPIEFQGRMVDGVRVRMAPSKPRPVLARSKQVKSKDPTLADFGIDEAPDSEI